jgi:hypothetical protein
MDDDTIGHPKIYRKMYLPTESIYAYYIYDAIYFLWVT